MESGDYDPSEKSDWHLQHKHVPNKRDIFDCSKIPYVERPVGAHRYIPLKEHAHFETPVNLHFSAVRVSVNLYGRGIFVEIFCEFY